MQIPDTTICSLCRQKNRKGLEYLFQMYYRPLVVWADTFVNDIGGAEDLVQEFFIHIWEKELLDGVKPETLKSYLYTAVRNRALNRLDKKDPLRRAIEMEGITPVWEEYDDFEEEIVKKVEQAIENLPPRSREIVKCVYLKNVKYKEVAQKYEISVATVKTLLVNSLKALRKNSAGQQELFLFLFCKKYFKSFNHF